MEFLYVPIPEYNFYSTDTEAFHDEWCYWLKSEHYLFQVKPVVDCFILGKADMVW